MLRVTSNSYYSRILTNINQNQSNLIQTRMRIASGKKVQYLSDEPTKMGSLLKHKELIKKNDQYMENLSNAMDYLSVASDALNHASDLLTTVRSLTVQGIDSISTDEYASFATQIDDFLSELMDVANTRFKGKYVFAGTSTTSQPFTMAGDRSSVAVTATGINGKQRLEIGTHQIETINISGHDAFLQNVDTFNLLIQLRDAFQNEDQATLESLLPQLDTALDQVLTSATRAGSLLNRFELLHQQYESENVTLKHFTSKIEDADLYEESINLQKQEMSLQAALTVTAKGMDLSLVNYLR
ncbi:MAG: flagellar hook-associated protein FlgL [Calditrichia bacterium]